jgi:acetyl esterase/lipase
MTNRRELISRCIGLAAASAVGGAFVGQTVVASEIPGAASIDPLRLVNPEFREFLESIIPPGAPSPEPLTAAMIQPFREGSKALGRPLLPAPAVVKRSIPGPKGAPDVVIYMTGAVPGAAKPAVLHMHGGGYIGGSAESNRRDIQDLAVNHDCVAVTVEYRLAPETTFPGSLEDNYAALRWLYANAAKLGVDRTRIALKGESAGGGHAAALAIAARDRGEIPICLQILIYPALDDRTGSSVSVPPYIGKYMWTSQYNRFAWTSLLGMPAGSARTPRGSVPARVQNLAGLAPAWIGVGSIDLFSNEDVEYGRRLLEAGVPTEIQLVPGGFHGFDIFVPKAPLAIAFTQGWHAALKRAFVQPVDTSTNRRCRPVLPSAADRLSIPQLRH